MLACCLKRREESIECSGFEVRVSCEVMGMECQWSGEQLELLNIETFLLFIIIVH